MQSIKLNDSLRKRILAVLTDGKFDEEIAALYPRAAKLANECYEKLFAVKERDLMVTLPSGWLPEMEEVNVSINKKAQALYFNGVLDCFPTPSATRRKMDIRPSVSKRFRMSDYCERGQLIEYSKSHPVAVEFFKLHAEGQAIIKAREQLEREVNSVLYSASTTGKLVSLWPEIKNVVASIAPVEQPQNLPAVVVKNLNEKLGLAA